jgi:hypothetical protein
LKPRKPRKPIKSLFQRGFDDTAFYPFPAPPPGDKSNAGTPGRNEKGKIMDTNIADALGRAGLPDREEVNRQDRKNKEVRAAERKADEKRAAWLRDNPPRKGLSEPERRELALIGLERASKVAHRQGDTNKAAKLDTLIAEARAHLEQHTIAKAEYEEQTRPGEILSAGVEPIAKRLQKTIGGFDTDAEAVAFVLKSWPLTKLRADAARAEHTLGKLSRRANEAQQAFWGTVERAAGLATGKPGSNEAITTVINMGLM